MGLDQPIDITAEQRKTVLTLLKRHLPNTTAWVYGSRTNWTARPQSDLDMVVFATPEQSARVSDLREAFEESNLPFRVDLFVWDTVSEEFRKQIEADHSVLVGRRDYRGATDEWRKLRLKEIVDLHREQINPEMQPDQWFQHFSIPAFDRDGDPSLELGADIRSNKFTVPSDSVLLSKLNPRIPRVWAPTLADGTLAVASTEFLILRPRNANRSFVKYLCLHPALRSALKALVTGTSGSHQRVHPSDALNIEALIPPLEEQRAIAHKLSILDDKIELNRRTNETLEAMAHTLFKSWFVDFDPVRAKMEGRDTGLPPDVAALFPDRLVYSELGEIPEEWIAENLGSYVEFQNGYAFKSVDWKNKGVPVVKIGSVKPGLVDLTAATCVSPETVVDLERFMLNPGDILVGMTGYPGETGLVPIHDPPPYLNQRVGRISAPQDYPENYAWIYAQVRSQSFKRHAEARAHGSAQANVSGRALLEYPVVFPGKALLKTYSDFATPLISRYLANDTMSRALATLRDTLLSKLISGDLRVKPGAQIAMEPAA